MKRKETENERVKKTKWSKNENSLGKTYYYEYCSQSQNSECTRRELTII